MRGGWEPAAGEDSHNRLLQSPRSVDIVHATGALRGECDDGGGEGEGERRCGVELVLVVLSQIADGYDSGLCL
jgi:hypothetical protein